MGRDRGVWTVVVCVLVVASLTTPFVGPVAADEGDDANEAPLPEAGLDQTVDVNDTVYLDAGGSRDPDGSIVSYEWEIEGPGGATFDPDCADCARTHFVVRSAGTFEVTVTVTDDDGATRSDTLRVTAERVEPPTVTLSGPSEVTAGTSASFDVSAGAGESPLARVTWQVNGSAVERSPLSGEDDDATFHRQFNDSGTYEVTARVVSRFGRATTETIVVNATEPAQSVGSSDRASTSGGSFGGGGGGGNSLEKEYFANEDYVFLNDMDGDDEVTYLGVTYDVSPGKTSYYYPDEVDGLGGNSRAELRRIGREEAKADVLDKEINDGTDWERVFGVNKEPSKDGFEGSSGSGSSSDNTGRAKGTLNGGSNNWVPGSGPPPSEPSNYSSGDSDNSLESSSSGGSSDNSGDSSSEWTPGSGPPPGAI